MIHGGREPDQLVGCQVDAFFDALGDLEFALASEQFHRTHFAHVHTNRIRSAPEFSVYSRYQGCRDFSGFFLIILGDDCGFRDHVDIGSVLMDLDTHIIDHADDFFHLLGIDDVTWQMIVYLRVGEVTLHLAFGNELF